MVVNRFFILGISIFLMLPSVLPTCILLDFEVNRDYIARVLCVEKDVKGSTCNGKCHLKKELKKAEERKNKSEKLAETKEVILFFSDQSIEIEEGILPKLEAKFFISQHAKIQPGFCVIHGQPPQT